MKKKTSHIAHLDIFPLTEKRWSGFETLFGEKGLSVQILRAAVDYVREQEGKIVEGYPVEPKKGKTADVFVWTGLASVFKKAGFVECARRSKTRPIMRYRIS